MGSLKDHRARGPPSCYSANTPVSILAHVNRDMDQQRRTYMREVVHQHQSVFADAGWPPRSQLASSRGEKV